jgi:DNA-binding XRE family transcriptional regulator
MRSKRGDTTGEQAARSIGMPRSTYYRIERGAQEPSYDTAVVLGRWLGWTAERVIEAARTPPE